MNPSKDQSRSSPRQPLIDDLARGYLQAQIPGAPIGRVLVVLCGLTHSGKSSLALRDPGLRRLARIENDGLRDLIARRAHDLRQRDGGAASPFGLDGARQAVSPEILTARRSVLRNLSDAVFTAGFESGVGLLHDSANKSASARRARLEQARAAGYRSAIVEVSCPVPTVVARLRAHDDELERAGQPRFWLAEYERNHEDQFEPPNAAEADEVLAVPFDTDVPVPLKCLH